MCPRGDVLLAFLANPPLANFRRQTSTVGQLTRDSTIKSRTRANPIHEHLTRVPRGWCTWSCAKFTVARAHTRIVQLAEGACCCAIGWLTLSHCPRLSGRGDHVVQSHAIWTSRRYRADFLSHLVWAVHRTPVFDRHGRQTPTHTRVYSFSFPAFFEPRDSCRGASLRLVLFLRRTMWYVSATRLFVCSTLNSCHRYEEQPFISTLIHVRYDFHTIPSRCLSREECARASKTVCWRVVKFTSSLIFICTA